MAAHNEMTLEHLRKMVRFSKRISIDPYVFLRLLDAVDSSDDYEKEKLISLLSMRNAVRSLGPHDQTKAGECDGEIRKATDRDRSGAAH